MNPMDAKHPPTMDPEALHRLARETSPQRVLRMVALFLEEIGQRGERITHALTVGDLPAIARESHALKSAAATFGAPALRHGAQTVDQACKSDQTALALTKAATLLKLIRETEAAFTNQIHDWPP